VINASTMISGRYFEIYPEGFLDFKESISNLRYQITEIAVKGKFMWWKFVSGDSTWYMWCTYGMSGQWSPGLTKHSSFMIEYDDLENKKIFFNDQRHFGTIKFVNDEKIHLKKLASLGPDMLSNPPDDVEFSVRVLKKSHRTIAENIMDQSVISGVGNYVKSEALYRSRISPKRVVSEISSEEFVDLRNSVINVMQESYSSKGASFDTYRNPDGSKGTKQFKFLVYDQKVAPCGHIVYRETTSDNRTSHWCQFCQKLFCEAKLAIKSPFVIVKASDSVILDYFKDFEKMKKKRKIFQDEVKVSVENEATACLEKEKDFLSKAKDLMNINKLKRTVNVGAEIFSAVSPFFEKPNTWNAVKAVASVGKILIEEVEIWSDDYFAGDEWIPPYSRDFNQTIIKAISGFKYETIRASDENCVIRIVDVEGLKVGYVYNTKLGTTNNIYVETEKLLKTQQVIKNLLWKSLKDTNLVLRHNKRISLHEDESRVIFESDDAFHSMTSSRAIEYSSYLKRCVDAGVSRSVMLYGPPGTGKSTLARTIIDRLQMRSFRIRVEDISNLENGTLFESIEIFQPDAIILDDFDRSSGQAQLLETLEFFQRHVKLVVATVNDRNSLDEAILRPGRFDELIFIKQMDPDVVKAVLGKDLEDAYEIVKDWPIAFINEYSKRRKFMSPEEAAKSTIELANRVKRLEKYNDTNEIDRMLKKKNSNPHDIEPNE